MTLKMSMMDEIDTALRTFANAIEHGDEKHRQWLRDAVESFIENGTVPPRPCPCEPQRSEASHIEGYKQGWQDAKADAGAATSEPQDSGATGEWTEEDAGYTDGDGRPYKHAKCGDKIICTGPELTIASAVRNHNATLAKVTENDAH